jgi:3-deoxy-manno-octulosonate cytidylyltransferase (CMP-KDO synthetase)
MDPNVVKVVTAQDGRALYFSRYPIPFRKPSPASAGAQPGAARHLKHVGLYLYRREFLLQFVRLEPTPLEISESLEQLRVLEHGYPIHVVEVAEDSISVDTPSDLEIVRALVARSG